MNKPTLNVIGQPVDFYDYIKVNREGIRVRVKNELFDNRQVWDQLPSASLKIAVDKLVREERSKAKGKLFSKYSNL